MPPAGTEMTSARLLDILADQLQSGTAVVWIGVAEVHGSAPRSPGTRMLVTGGGQYGTIGGGHLELSAIDIARQMLTDAAAGTLPPARIERFALGARVGQCCGGAVKLAFDLIAPPACAWVHAAQDLEQQECDWVRLIEIGGHHVSVAACLDFGAEHADPALARTLADLCATPADGATLTGLGLPGHTHVLELFRPIELHLALFGAGHVGRALVEILARLPIRVTWIDARETEFLAWMPRNIRPVIADCPQDEIRHLPADCAVLIATHSHALDLDLVRAWLDRGDFRFLGLIGSRSKRANFEAKLRARGFDHSQLQQLVCPVGERGVIGKEPEVIALAIATQLMRLRRADATVRTHPQQTCVAQASTP